VLQTHPLVSKFPNSTHGRKRHITFALPWCNPARVALWKNSPAHKKWRK
jgi:hypothetical protein